MYDICYGWYLLSATFAILGICYGWYLLSETFSKYLRHLLSAIFTISNFCYPRYLQFATWVSAPFTIWNLCYFLCYPLYLISSKLAIGDICYPCHFLSRASHLLWYLRNSWDRKRCKARIAKTVDSKCLVAKSMSWLLIYSSALCNLIVFGGRGCRNPFHPVIFTDKAPIFWVYWALQGKKPSLVCIMW